MTPRHGYAGLRTGSPEARRLISVGVVGGSGYLVSLAGLTVWTLL